MIDPDHTYFTKPQYEKVKESKMNTTNWWPVTDEEADYLSNPPKPKNK